MGIYTACMASGVLNSRIALGFGPLLSLGGCGAAVDHPSLAPRAVEEFRVAPEAAEVPPPGPAAPADTPEIAARAAALVAQARAGEEAFAGLAEGARGAVARAGGTAPGGELWVQAQQALSRAEAARGEVARSLADLDRMRIEQGAAPAIEAAIAEVSRIDEAQRALMAELARKLSAP